MEKTVDYIIVGQGLAGTVLAHTLLQKNRSVLVIDNPSFASASKVAAGLYNPVVFKRLVKSWMAEELLAYMDWFYPKMENLLNEKFYFKRQIVKPFSEEHEKVLWGKKINEEVGKYLGKAIQNNFLIDKINNPLGAAEVTAAGNIDPVLFIDQSRKFFKANSSLAEELFQADALILDDDEIKYKTWSAKKIIFCEGHRTIDNPWFKWLSFKLTKGEVLTVKIPGLLSDEQKEKVINKGVFVLPIGDEIFKVGATYEWNDLSEIPTEKGKAFLIDALSKVLKINFEVLNHQAGIRPTVSDRRPLLGLHPKYKNMGVFNGLGTKGVMLAPYFANHLVEHLENNTELNGEVDIKRFYKNSSA